LTDRSKGMLGLARRAGKLVMGSDRILASKKDCLLIICASDASERTVKNMRELGTEMIFSDSTKRELGELLGAGEVAAVAVTDKNFATAIVSAQ